MERPKHGSLCMFPLQHELCAEVLNDAPLLACNLVEAGHLCQTWWNDFGLTKAQKQLGIVNALLNTPWPWGLL